MKKMAYLGHPITEADILRAMARFDQEVRADFKFWRRYAFHHEGRSYPPKRIVSLAIDEAVYGGGTPFNSVIEALGWQVVNIE